MKEVETNPFSKSLVFGAPCPKMKKGMSKVDDSINRQSRFGAIIRVLRDEGNSIGLGQKFLWTFVHIVLKILDEV